MYIVNHQEHCGEYRYCPERHSEVVSLRGHSSVQDGLRFSIKASSIRVGYFIWIAGMLGRVIRNGITALCRKYRVNKMGYRPQSVQRVFCCARL